MAAGFETDTVYRLETNLDDCSPELTAAAMERLFEAGALDVWFEPIYMKKQRPGVMLSALCEEGDRDKIADLILTETTAFGVRVEKIHRLKLARQMAIADTCYGAIAVKLGLKGDRVVQVAPEFEACRAASKAAGVPLRTVYEEAQRVWYASQKQPE